MGIQTCRIDEADGVRSNDDALFDEIASGAGLRTDQGTVVSDQTIEQAALPGIGGAEDHGPDSIPQHRPVVTRRHQAAGSSEERVVGDVPADRQLQRREQPLGASYEKRRKALSAEVDQATERWEQATRKLKKARKAAQGAQAEVCQP